MSGINRELIRLAAAVVGGAVAGGTAGRRATRGQRAPAAESAAGADAEEAVPVVRHVGVTWAHQTLDVDGNQYDGSAFEDCVFRYRGLAPVGFLNCRIVRCRWAFVGPAAATLGLLSDLHGGFGAWGQQVVQRVFAEVTRRGATPPQNP